MNLPRDKFAKKKAFAIGKSFFSGPLGNGYCHYESCSKPVFRRFIPSVSFSVEAA